MLQRFSAGVECWLLHEIPFDVLQDELNGDPILGSPWNLHHV